MPNHHTVQGKERLDILLVKKKLCPSRTKAQALIIAGQVLVDDYPVIKAGFEVNNTATIRLKDNLKYVSRAGLKLEKALNFFNINPKGLIFVDIGSSTGGFTDCLLQNQAKKIYAVDCGTNQLTYKIRSNPKVITYENTNAKYLKSSHFHDSIDYVTIDVSFISITKLLNSVIKSTAVQTGIIALVKPQFEANKEDIEKGGIIKKIETHYKIFYNLFAFLDQNQIFYSQLIPSPIKGKKGNIEYLLLLKINPNKNEKKISFDDMSDIVKNSFNFI